FFISCFSFFYIYLFFFFFFFFFFQAEDGIRDYKVTGVQTCALPISNSPGTQALFTFVGPLTSLVLGAIFSVLSIAAGGGAHPGLLAATLSWLGYRQEFNAGR